MAKKVETVYDEVSICGFCTTTESHILYPTNDIFGNNYTINKCHRCRAIFLAPRPTKEILEKAYDDTYYGPGEKKFSAPFIENIIDYFRMGRAKRLARFLHEDSNVLDIGCGNGRFLKYLQKCGKFNLFGTEMEGRAAQRALQIPGIDIKIGSLLNHDFTNEQFDAITMFHVFEHLDDPRQTLEEVTRLLSHNGTLVMSFPNIHSFQSRTFKGKWFHLDPPRHLFFFGHRDFIKMMSKYGFVFVKRKDRSFEQNPFGMIQSILNVFFKRRELLYERLKGNKAYARCNVAQLILQYAFFIFLFPVCMIFDYVASFMSRGATVEYTFIKAMH
ncbi:MAG: class I SAM-dependent methyltransferase [Bacteroidota bacterium]